MDSSDGALLPGYKKKSFMLPYRGGEIWFEHLDGLYGYEELVLSKLDNDTSEFSKPVSPAFVCFVFNETKITERIIRAVTQSILGSGKHYMKIAFVGLDRKSSHQVKKQLSENGFAMNFLKGLEDAKEWLITN